MAMTQKAILCSSTGSLLLSWRCAFRQHKPPTSGLGASRSQCQAWLFPYPEPLPRVATRAAWVRPSKGAFRESCPMHKKKSRSLLPPVRVRQEPPTVAEAVAAAQALTPDQEQQVEITAGLMGLTPDKARPFVLAAPPLNLQRSAAPLRRYTGTDVSRRAAGPVVVVERRSRLVGQGLRSGRPLVRPREL